MFSVFLSFSLQPVLELCVTSYWRVSDLQHDKWSHNHSRESNVAFTYSSCITPQPDLFNFRRKLLNIKDGVACFMTLFSCCLIISSNFGIINSCLLIRVYLPRHIWYMLGKYGKAHSITYLRDNMIYKI